MRRRLLWAVVSVGVLLVAGLTALAFAAGSTTRESAAPEAFDLPVLHGSGRVRLADLRGQPVVVTLFASWCTPCRDELPRYAAVARQVRGRVRFVAVDSHETGDGWAFASGLHLPGSGFTLAADPTGGLFTAYHARGLPVIAFYSPDGRLLRTDNGALPTAVLEQALQQLYGV